MESLILFLLLGLLIFAGGLFIRHREAVSRWLKDPTSDPKEKRKLLLRHIEDANDDLARLDEKEAAKQKRTNEDDD